MPRFSDPLRGVDNVTPENALDIQLEKFKNLSNGGGEFSLGLEKLINVRDVYLVAKASGYLEQIPTWPNFVNQIKWLNGEAEQGPAASGAVITSYDDIDAIQASWFNSNAAWIESNSLVNPDYKLAATIRGAISAQKLIKTEPNLNGLIDTQEARLESQRKSFELLISETESQSVDKLNKQAATAVTKIKKEADEKLTSIQQADALKVWQAHYDGLLGKKVAKRKPRQWLPAKQNDKMIKRSLKWVVRPVLNSLSKLDAQLEYFVNRLNPSTDQYIRLADQAKLWRNIWLVLLVVSEAVLTYLFTYVWKLDYKTQLAQILAYKFFVVLLFGVLFTSSNKNYRIYANLTDQIRHRSVVAKTIRGIVLDESIGTAQNDYKAELVAVGAKAMFEMKNTGHLSKKDGTSPLVETVREIIK